MRQTGEVTKTVGDAVYYWMRQGDALMGIKPDVKQYTLSAKVQKAVDRSDLRSLPAEEVSIALRLIVDEYWAVTAATHVAIADHAERFLTLLRGRLLCGSLSGSSVDPSAQSPGDGPAATPDAR